MKKQQIKATKDVRRALERANVARLSAGIFDGWFCLWPSEKMPTPGPNFFEELDQVGGVSFRPSGMWLDGGAGV